MKFNQIDWNTSNDAGSLVGILADVDVVGIALELRRMFVDIQHLDDDFGGGDDGRRGLGRRQNGDDVRVTRFPIERLGQEDLAFSVDREELINVDIDIFGRVGISRCWHDRVVELFAADRLHPRDCCPWSRFKIGISITINKDKFKKLI